jgi:hypothetical protein
MVSSSRDNIYRLPNFGIEGAVPEYLRRPKPPVRPWWLEPLPPPLPVWPSPPNGTSPSPDPLPSQPRKRMPSVPGLDAPKLESSLGPSGAQAADDLSWLLDLLRGIPSASAKRPGEGLVTQELADARPEPRSAIRLLSSPLLGRGRAF